MPLNFTFAYFKNNYKSLIISTNGYVLFSTSSQCCPLVRPALSNSIPALNYDLTTLKGNGTIYYKYLNSTVASSQSEMSAIKSDVNRVNPTFVPLYAFKITFSSVQAFKSSSLLASFQVVLSTNSLSYFVTLKYTSCLGNVTLLSTPGLNYIDLKGLLVVVPITNPCTSSNVNLTGTWVFDVTSVKGIRFLLIF